MANFTKLTPEKKENFLVFLRTTPNVSQAAKSIGVSRQAIYQERKEDKEFAESWDDAIGEALDNLEAALFDRAVNGVTNDVFYEGVSCGTKTEYSDAASMFLLKNRRPEVFSDKVRQEITGKDGGAIQLQNLSADELAARITAILERAGERRARANSESSTPTTS